MIYNELARTSAIDIPEEPMIIDADVSDITQRAIEVNKAVSELRPFDVSIAEMATRNTVVIADRIKAAPGSFHRLPRSVQTNLKRLAVDSVDYLYAGDRERASDEFRSDLFLKPGQETEAEAVFYGLDRMHHAFLLNEHPRHREPEARDFVDRFGLSFALAYRGVHHAGMERYVIPTERNYFRGNIEASTPIHLRQTAISAEPFTDFL